MSADTQVYPCPPDLPLPIAQRTHRYIASCGLPSVEIGRPKSAAAGTEAQA